MYESIYSKLPVVILIGPEDFYKEDKIIEIYEKVNQEVQAERPINVGFLTRDEAELEPDLIRTKINLLPSDIREIRTIDISGLDLQADGGTHVANTLEVGQVSIVGHESKGRINKRLRIALQS